MLHLLHLAAALPTPSPAVHVRVPVNQTHDTARFTPRLFDAADLSAMDAHFGDMPLDPYLKTPRASRTRRYAKLQIARLDEPAPRNARYMTNVFIQTGYYNDLVKTGEVALVRRYERLSDQLLTLPAVQRLLDHCSDEMLAMGARHDVPYELGLHTIRTSAPGMPTPEGVHRDGYAFVHTTIIDRQGIEGGSSRVHTGKYDEPLLDVPMIPGDSLIINDEAVMHSVSNITVVPGREVGHRDVIVITARPWASGEAGEEEARILASLEGTVESPDVSDS